MTDYKTSGLDMGETIEWHKASKVKLPSITTNRSLPYPVENQDFIELSNKELSGLFYMFPENSRKRSILRKIMGKPVTWFHKNSTNEKPISTTNQEKALSSTAIVPSYIDYTPWKQLKVPTADIWLHKIPDSIPKNVRKNISSEGFIHEVGHSIVQPALYLEGYTLRFPDGKIVNGLEAILNFANLAEQKAPISNYASTYRGKNNKFESDNPNYNIKTAISEELCETIAAYLLGFAYCNDYSRSKNPFVDRSRIKGFIRKFLNAELIKD